MANFLKESELAKPVSRNIYRRGFRKQANEVSFFEYSMDLYGYSTARKSTIAVELKLHRWKRAFEQALIYQLCADYVYLALPYEGTKKVELSLLKQYRLGLIGVHHARGCTVLLEAKKSNVIIPTYRDFYIKLILENKA